MIVGSLLPTMITGEQSVKNIHMNDMPHYDTAVTEIKDIVTQWVKDQPNYDGSDQGTLF